MWLFAIVQTVCLKLRGSLMIRMYIMMSRSRKSFLPISLTKSNNRFRKLRQESVLSKKETKYFTYQYRKSTNLGKLYLLPKIYRRIFAVPGRFVISNCGTTTEKHQKS